MTDTERIAQLQAVLAECQEESQYHQRIEAAGNRVRELESALKTTRTEADGYADCTRRAEAECDELRSQIQQEREVSDQLATWIEKSSLHWHNCSLGNCVCGKQAALAQHKKLRKKL